jgi:hypothetical protein
MTTLDIIPGSLPMAIWLTAWNLKQES